MFFSLFSVLSFYLVLNLHLNVFKRNSVLKIKENLGTMVQMNIREKVNIKSDFIYSSRAYERLSEFFYKEKNKGHSSR